MHSLEVIIALNNLNLAIDKERQRIVQEAYETEKRASRARYFKQLYAVKRCPLCKGDNIRLLVPQYECGNCTRVFSREDLV